MGIYKSQNTRDKWWKRGKKCRRNVAGRWVQENVCILSLNCL